MTQTNQQGAPEALRPIARYKIGYHTDEWGMRSSTPSGIPDHAGTWVRYEDHVAALQAQQPAPSVAVALSDDLRDRLVAISEAIADQDDRAAQAMLREILAAQQPATHVQNPAGIEHVAGDVSKNGPESNMAQQPAPSAAAVVNPDPHAELRKTWQPGQRWQARSFRNGQWGPWTDAVASEPFWFPHQDYRRHPDDLAPQPSPTPQADSAPHPIDPAIAADLERSDWTPEEALRWYAAGKHYDTVPNGDGSSSARILDNGAVASNALMSMSREYAEHKGDVALTAPQADSQPAPVVDEREAFEADYLRAFPGKQGRLGRTKRTASIGYEHAMVQCRWEGWQARAASATADSVTAPAGGVDDAVDAIALARYKVVPAHESMFHRFAVVAGDGKQQLYLGREVECENMARKFAGAFLDGAFYQSNIAPTPPAQAADSVLEDAARLEQIAEAIRDYHYALDTRKHGGVAESAAFNSICLTMGMQWEQGKEADRRTALAANGGKP